MELDVLFHLPLRVLLGWVSEWKSLSCTRFSATRWTIQSMESSRPQYWSGYLSLLQGVLPTQTLNPGLPHCRRILYQLSHQGSKKNTRMGHHRLLQGIFSIQDQLFLHLNLPAPQTKLCYWNKASRWHNGISNWMNELVWMHECIYSMLRRGKNLANSKM